MPRRADKFRRGPRRSRGRRIRHRRGWSRVLLPVGVATHLKANSLRDLSEGGQDVVRDRELGMCRPAGGLVPLQDTERPGCAAVADRVLLEPVVRPGDLIVVGALNDGEVGVEAVGEDVGAVVVLPTQVGYAAG